MDTKLRSIVVPVAPNLLISSSQNDIILTKCDDGQSLFHFVDKFEEQSSFTPLEEKRFRDIYLFYWIHII